MTDLQAVLLAGATGLALGGVFFGGLWWTIRASLSARQPALLFLASLLLRSAVAITGFIVVADGRWLRLLVCLLGFIAARVLITRWAGPPVAPRDTQAKEVSDAP